MHETEADLAALQALIDRTHERAGPHLNRIVTPEVTAAERAAWLTGMRLLVVGTVTADGRPLAGPVDGIFHRGPSTSARLPTRSACATSGPGRW